MKKQLFIVSFMLASMGAAYAQDLTPKQQYAADSKRASTRYADDKKLCAEETSSSVRMQCLRDARSEYNKSVADAKAAMKAAAPSSSSNNQAAICQDCGSVVSVNVSDKPGEGSALGLIAGGVAGALLGHQVGSGTGQDLATVAGAAGGAYAGRKVEQKVKSTKVWAVAVQYDNGNKNTFNFDHDPGLAVGDKVRNAGDSIVRR
ncbi:glycine zipper 2TM domain-containing protein [Undibacterium sp.]|uniref:glycine zipper 2TM domain-containing protein n=1 Tax=Undibacterium sp. TaxID=1914977 RepID=UPI002CD47A0E|nr:glycine zipper 2TM domain-containing protein [Undibacterium sp.]HTD03842.1 glycine zipper 2TM domain-containing protein [Undibacterium sp.]